MTGGGTGFEEAPAGQDTVAAPEEAEEVVERFEEKHQDVFRALAGRAGPPGR